MIIVGRLGCFIAQQLPMKKEIAYFTEKNIKETNIAAYFT